MRFKHTFCSWKFDPIVHCKAIWSYPSLFNWYSVHHTIFVFFHFPCLKLAPHFPTLTPHPRDPRPDLHPSNRLAPWRMRHFAPITARPCCGGKVITWRWYHLQLKQIRRHVERGRSGSGWLQHESNQPWYDINDITVCGYKIVLWF